MLISVVMLLAVVSLAVSLVTRRPEVTSTAPGPGVKQVPVLVSISHQPINLVMFQLRLGSSGIARSYAKIPVEIKNMLPSNVAYQQLYDV